MIDDTLSALTLFSILGSGMMAGLFFTFSVCVMKALSRLPAANGIAAMQSINVTILNPLFGLVFGGTAAACFVLAASSLFQWNEESAVYRLLGGILYLAGAIGVTMAFNISRNNALAAVTPENAEAASFWSRYVAEWTGWNHVRTIASIGAVISLIIAYRAS